MVFSPMGAVAGKTLIAASDAYANSLPPPEAFSLEAYKFADWDFDRLVRFDGNSQKIVLALPESLFSSRPLALEGS